jgi:hypothetical protein
LHLSAVNFFQNLPKVSLGEDKKWRESELHTGLDDRRTKENKKVEGPENRVEDKKLRGCAKTGWT